MRRRAAFTLVEMLAVMLLLGMVVATTINFYIDLSRQSAAATERVREVRRGVTVVDRIARDLEGSVLVATPAGVDPLDHPWVFLGERRGDGPGSDHLRFVTRNHRPRGAVVGESDLLLVTYALRDDGDRRDLVRWSQPWRAPESLELDIPVLEEDGARVLAEGVDLFAVRWLTQDGAWKEEWNSSTLDASQLPRGADLQLAWAPDPDADPELAPEPPPPVRRQVLIPVSALDLELLLAEGDLAADVDSDGDGEPDSTDPDDDNDGIPDDEDPVNDSDPDPDRPNQVVTIRDCISRNPNASWVPAVEAAIAAGQVNGSLPVGSFGLTVPANCQ